MIDRLICLVLGHKGINKKDRINKKELFTIYCERCNKIWKTPFYFEK